MTWPPARSASRRSAPCSGAGATARWARAVSAPAAASATRAASPTAARRATRRLRADEARPASARVAVAPGLRRDLAGIEMIHLLDQLVGDEVLRVHLLLEHGPLEEELDVVAVVDLGVLSPPRHAGRLQAPVGHARLQHLDVVLHRGGLVLAGGLRRREHLVDDAHRRLGIVQGEDRRLGVGAPEADQILPARLERLL